MFKVETIPVSHFLALVHLRLSAFSSYDRSVRPYGSVDSYCVRPLSVIVCFILCACRCRRVVCVIFVASPLAQDRSVFASS